MNRLNKPAQLAGHRLRLALVALLAAWGSGAMAAEPIGDPARERVVQPGREPVRQAEGVIQKLDFGAGEMIINGMSYKVSPSANVSIRGSYGAFTMLQKGMKVKFVYTMYSNEHLEITSLDQMPDNTRIFEH